LSTSAARLLLGAIGCGSFREHTEQFEQVGGPQHSTRGILVQQKQQRQSQAARNVLRQNTAKENKKRNNNVMSFFSLFFVLALCSVSSYGLTWQL